MVCFVQKIEKTEEKIQEIKERRARNRENHEQLFGKVISFRDGYLIKPPVEQPDREWKDDEDPFGICSIRFEEKGKTMIDDGYCQGEVVTWEIFKKMRLEIEANAEERLENHLRSDMEIEEAYERVEDF